MTPDPLQIADDALDRELLRLTCRGHDASARQLWARHAPALVAIAHSLSVGGERGARGRGSVEASHDLVQTVFCRLLELSPAQVRQIESPAAYLSRMVRNEALNAIRAAGRHRAHALAAGEARAGALGPPGAATPPPRPASDLDAALERLDPDDRELLILKHAAGLTFDQVAGALNQNRSTIATRYRAALDRLRALLAPARGHAAHASPATTGGAG